jgi:DNA replication and repair protein RecF
MAELADVLVAHVIDPSSHELIEGGPSVRRRFVDAGVFHVEHSYLEVWRNYRRVLGQRNAALKQGERGASLKVWSQPLLEAAEAIHRARSAYVERVGVQTQAIGKRLLSRELALVYRPGWRVGLDYPSALAESERRDRETGFTQVGPHRADVAVRMDGKLVREQASRGQQKLVAAACVLAEAAELAGSGRLGSATQMLLVDDPGAELDSGSLERLFAELDGVPIQQLVTAIGGETLPDTRSAVFHVEQGRVKAVV